MVRLYLFAEGPTEQTFAQTVLAPHLVSFGVESVHGVKISSSITNKEARGGGRNYEAMKQDILIKQKSNPGSDVFFTTMIDLYAIPHKFPGLAEADALKHIPYRRVEHLEAAFAADMGDRRFVPHIQLHEFETLLFCEPSWFAYSGASAKQIEELAEIAAAYTSPELIDEGHHSAPRKRIESVIGRYKNEHALIGPQVAELIGLPTIRAKCPHFDAWITKLETLRPLDSSPDMPLQPAPADV